MRWLFSSLDPDVVAVRRGVLGIPVLRCCIVSIPMFLLPPSQQVVVQFPRATNNRSDRKTITA